MNNKLKILLGILIILCILCVTLAIFYFIAVNFIAFLVCLLMYA